MTPTAAKPDMASLRFIKESELRRGNIIGSGAFGTVYKVSERGNRAFEIVYKISEIGIGAFETVYKVSER